MGRLATGLNMFALIPQNNPVSTLPSRFAKALTRWHHTFFVDWLALPLPEKERT